MCGKYIWENVTVGHSFAHIRLALTKPLYLQMEAASQTGSVPQYLEGTRKIRMWLPSCELNVCLSFVFAFVSIWCCAKSCGREKEISHVADVPGAWTLNLQIVGRQSFLFTYKCSISINQLHLKYIRKSVKSNIRVSYKFKHVIYSHMLPVSPKRMAEHWPVFCNLLQSELKIIIRCSRGENWHYFWQAAITCLIKRSIQQFILPNMMLLALTIMLWPFFIQTLIKEPNDGALSK